MEQERTEIGVIISLRVQARKNYTCTNDQDMTAWTESTPTQVAVAIGLDEAAREDLEQRGYSGMGAGARLLAMIDGDEEEIEDMGHPSVQALPVGSVKRLRHYISQERKNQYWDGHNHVTVPTSASDALLRQINNGNR